MVVTAGKRLKSENGASLVAALLFFVLCGVAASMILAAASASAGKMQQVPVTDQKRFAVESGAAFLRDELSDSKTAVKITDVRVVDSREEEPDYSEEYVYTGGETLDDDSILGSCIKQVYTSLAEEDGQNGSFSEQEGNAQNGSSPETAEQDFTFSVQLTQTDGTQTSIKDLDQLQTAAHLTMDPQYNITVDISDTQTGDDHPENRCERKLTVAAKVHVDEMEEEEEHEETNENGDVISEWTITTTTRIRIPVCQEADSRMKEHVDRLFGKLRSSKGETLAELLVSVLVIVLGLTMFATAMMSSKKMLVKGDAVMQAYYTQRNILEGEETKDERNGRLILEQNGTGTDLGRSAGNEGAGKYRIDLYSDQEGTKTGQYFRYSRKN